MSKFIASAWSLASLSFAAILLRPCSISSSWAWIKSCLAAISLLVISSSIACAFLNNLTLSVAVLFTLSSACNLISLIFLFAFALSTCSSLSIWCAFCLALVTLDIAETSESVSSTKPVTESETLSIVFLTPVIVSM